jgi:CHAT domain-containing protein
MQTPVSASLLTLACEEEAALCRAATGAPAESLSELARVFFNARARSLLISHWEADSESTVKLITKAVTELRADPKIGRAEALRRSMLSMFMSGKSYETHPTCWAPFVLVGDGGIEVSRAREQLQRKR